MQLLLMFSIGYILPTTEPQIVHLGVPEKNAGFWFSINTVAYGLASLVVSYLPSSINKPRIMLFGNCLMVIAFFVIGPSPLFYHESLAMTAIGLGLIGFAGGFIYGNI